MDARNGGVDPARAGSFEAAAIAGDTWNPSKEVPPLAIICQERIGPDGEPLAVPVISSRRRRGG